MNWREQILDPDSLDLDAFIRATFSFAVPRGTDVRKAAVMMLRILTARTQRLVRSRFDPYFDGAVVHVGPVGEWTEMTLAFPLIHSTPAEGLTHLLQLLASPAEYVYADGIWLQRVDLPRPFLASVPGPRLGINGIRSLLGVTDRPLLALQVGPRNIELNSEVLKAYREALLGGVDLLVDDILLGDPPTGALALQNRVPQLVRLCEEASSTTGSRKVYITSLAGSPSQLMAKAEWAVNVGVNGFVVNGFTQGLGTLEDLSRRNFGACLITTNMGSGMLSRLPNFAVRTEDGRKNNTANARRPGIDEQVFSKLSRLAGADAVHTGTTGAECFDINWSDAVRALAQPLASPNGNVPAAFRVAEGDLQMINLWPNMRELGNDTIFEVHSALLSQPRNIKVRAKRFIALLDGLKSVSDNIGALRHYQSVATGDPDLQAALNSLNFANW
jgi:ribulose 1,5-bisphosphate carboxylase large subunit-like protein